jgi:hypothetical protein
LKSNDEIESIVDLIDPEGPTIVDQNDLLQHNSKVIKKMEILNDNKWLKVKLIEDEDGDFIVSADRDDKKEEKFKKSKI